MARTRALRILVIVLGLSALSLCIANKRVQAAYEAYLKIDGLAGGATDRAHVGWIAISRIASGNLSGAAAGDRGTSPTLAGLLSKKSEPGAGAAKVSKSGSAVHPLMQTPEGIGSGASGKRMPTPIVIVKEIDKSSPMLAAACASGKLFPLATVEIGAKQYKLFDVMIASVQRSSGGGRPVENVTLTYTKMEVGR